MVADAKTWLFFLKNRILLCLLYRARQADKHLRLDIAKIRIEKDHIFLAYFLQFLSIFVRNFPIKPISQTCHFCHVYI